MHKHYKISYDILNYMYIELTFVRFIYLIIYLETIFNFILINNQIFSLIESKLILK
jgi:hypothetical protein